MNKLETLIILRHGENDHDGFLTPEGHQKIEKLGARLKKRFHISEKNTCAVHSGELRALKTIQSLLPEIDEYPDRVLFSNDRICDIHGAIELINIYGETTQILIVITHLELAEALPQKFGAEVLGVDDFPDREVSKGCGWIIDVRRKTCEFVSS